jgi:hypothetical protein
MTFLLIIIALSLTPTVQQQVTYVTGTGGDNLTGAARALATLISLFWVILVISIGVAAVYVQFKGM